MQFSLKQLLGAVFLCAGFMYAAHVGWLKDYQHTLETKRLENLLALEREKNLIKQKKLVEMGSQSVIIGHGAGTTVVRGTYVIVGHENVKYDLVIIGGVDLIELQKRVEQLEVKK